MPKKVKELSIAATVNFLVEKRYIAESTEKLKKLLNGEFIKVKEGIYRNAISGFITEVKEILPKARNLRITASVELSVERDVVNEPLEELKKSLKGTYVQVKGGKYENLIGGPIVEVKVAEQK